MSHILIYSITIIHSSHLLSHPITSFIATVYVTAQLANRTELIAILSSGKSFKSILNHFYMDL